MRKSLFCPASTHVLISFCSATLTFVSFQSRTIMDNLPPMLRQVLACTINKGLFAKVSAATGQLSDLVWVSRRF